MTTEPVRFHFYSLRFTPYKELEGKSNTRTILMDIMTYIMNKKQNGRGHLIDRNQNRDQDGPRELFMTSAIIMLKERRIRCSIALLRSGKIPMLKPTDKFLLVPLDTVGTVAEETHFFIDYSKGDGIICVEFNNFGPRISDIEYYLRNIARDTLKVSKVTDVNLFFDSTIDKTLAELKNVLNMDIKVQPKMLAQMDTEIVGQYFTGINSIGHKLKPKYIRLEAFFQMPGKSVTSSEINVEANTMIQYLLKKFKAKPTNIDCFENFVVKYEDKDGIEEVFNLLKGKKEIIKEVDFKKIKRNRDWYELIEKDLDTFIQNN